MLVQCELKGAVVAWDGRTESVSADEVEAVDTCGAGDNFVGGFLTGLLRGLDPVDCTRLGCAAGTLCVGRKGAVAATADKAVVDSLLGRFGLI